MFNFVTNVIFFASTTMVTFGTVVNMFKLADATDGMLPLGGRGDRAYL
jgi:hypothetical protein